MKTILWIIHVLLSAATGFFIGFALFRFDEVTTRDVFILITLFGLTSALTHAIQYDQMKKKGTV
jgi:ABC-type branched-subunit amino acid transport system permease subunit